MTERLPGHVKCQTLNSLGHGVWAKVSSKKLTLDAKKTYRLMKEEIDGLTGAHKRLAYDYMGDMMKLVSRAKINGYIPEGVMEHAKRLITVEDFWAGVGDDGEDFPDSVRDIVDSVLTRAITGGHTTGQSILTIRFICPRCLEAHSHKYPVVMVDEAQDLSPLNHEMLSRLRAGRLIAVGDPWQSIYGFRGAVSNGMQHLVRTFNMTEADPFGQLPLPPANRCAGHTRTFRI